MASLLFGERFTWVSNGTCGRKKESHGNRGEKVLEVRKEKRHDDR